MTRQICALLLAILSLACPKMGNADASGHASVIDKITHEVSLTSYKIGRLTTKTTTRAEIARNCPLCINEDGQHYYDSIPTLNRSIVNDCAAKAPMGKTVEVSETFKYLCRKRGFPWTNDRDFLPANYRLTNQPNGIHVGLKVRVNIATSVAPVRAQYMLAQTRACIPLIRNVWAGYGIFYDLKFETEKDSTPGEPDATTAISDTEGRSYSKNYSFLTDYNQMCLSAPLKGTETAQDRAKACESTRQHNYCSRLLHETAHLLGLGDEYEDKELCPDRIMIPNPHMPASAMGNDAAGIDYLVFYPRHIKQIIKPLCP